MSLLRTGVVAALDRIAGAKYVKARELSVSINTLNNWTNGVTDPSEENLARLANKARVTQDWIRNGGSNPTEDEGN